MVDKVMDVMTLPQLEERLRAIFVHKIGKVEDVCSTCSGWKIMHKSTGVCTRSLAAAESPSDALVADLYQRVSEFQDQYAVQIQQAAVSAGFNAEVV